jgi:predicted N-acyltransferase
MIRALSSLSQISAEAWNDSAASTGAAFNPFVSHEFLNALEKSGSATARTGWAAQHLVLEVAGEVCGVVPCYLKSHSMGEYVFDHGWADAFARAGGNYYPKLQISVPFTPATGPRLLAATPEHRAALAQGIIDLCTEHKASSAHITFTREAEALESTWLKRNDLQFHWLNAGYASFDDFLASLASAKRKNLRKERKSVADAGITFEQLTGDALQPHHWDNFFKFYMDTGARKWGQPYLTRSFFDLIHHTMRDKILLILAKRDSNTIAGALNFIGGDTLYGRNWGCIENHPNLHFETCYYQAIDYAIANGLKCVEAGAQGEHKLARGYVPVKTTSLHHFAHPGLGRAVANYLEEERRVIAENQEILKEHLPFKRETE